MERCVLPLAIGTKYRMAAREADMRHHSIEDSPIPQRLATLVLTGAAFVRFCKASETVQKLVAVMAKARVKQQTLHGAGGRRRRRPNSLP